MSVTVIIPAAGAGRRLGFGVPKALVEIGGKPLIIHTLQPFLAFEDVREVVVAVPPDEEKAFEALTGTYSPGDIIRIVRGGRSRQDSVMNAFQALDAGKSDIVLVHDAARPLVTTATISDVINKARKFGAAVAVVPVTDTLKSSRGDVSTLTTVDRDGLYHAQTPQGFQYAILREALETARSAGISGTDTTSLVERIGLPVKAAAGDKKNFKITTRAELVVAEILLKS